MIHNHRPAVKGIAANFTKILAAKSGKFLQLCENMGTASKLSQPGAGVRLNPPKTKRDLFLTFPLDRQNRK